MPADEIGAILGSLREAFGLAADAEVSAEMDPGTFDEEKLRAFLAAGVNRVSLGVQSFDDGVLQRAGTVARRASGGGGDRYASAVRGAEMERGFDQRLTGRGREDVEGVARARDRGGGRSRLGV